MSNNSNPYYPTFSNSPVIKPLSRTRRVVKFFSRLRMNRAAVIESGKIMFSLIGIGSVMANIVVAGRWFFLPVVLVFFGAWFALYLQMEGVQ